MSDMRYRPLGDSGLMVSVVGLGCNNLGRVGSVTETEAGSQKVIDAALDAGITLFDTADVYGVGRSEEILGGCLGARRDEAVIATKFGGDMGGANGPDWGARGSRRYLRRAVEASLRRLDTDHIDLYQYHWPDHVTPIEETLAALGELVTEGKVRYIGSSNLAAWQVVEADLMARSAGTTRFISAQNRYNLLERAAETELVPAAEAYRVGVLPYFPLASGLLTGKYRPDQAAPSGTRLHSRPERLEAADWPTIDALTGYARARGISLLDVAIGGLAARPGVSSVIAGATRPEQVEANVRAGRWEPSETDAAALAELTPTP